jgi:hypothetical protein
LGHHVICCLFIKNSSNIIFHIDRHPSGSLFMHRSQRTRTQSTVSQQSVAKPSQESLKAVFSEIKALASLPSCQFLQTKAEPHGVKDLQHLLAYQDEYTGDFLEHLLADKGFLACHPNPDGPKISSPWCEHSAFFLAIKNRAASLLINARAESPIHYAARRGHAKFIEHLRLYFNARIDTLDCDGNTPLHYAVQNNHVETVKTLIVEGAKWRYNLEAKSPIDLVQKQTEPGRQIDALLSDFEWRLQGIVDDTTGNFKEAADLSREYSERELMASRDWLSRYVRSENEKSSRPEGHLTRAGSVCDETKSTDSHSTRVSPTATRLFSDAVPYHIAILHPNPQVGLMIAALQAFWQIIAPHSEEIRNQTCDEIVTWINRLTFISIEFALISLREPSGTWYQCLDQFRKHPLRDRMLWVNRTQTMIRLDRLLESLLAKEQGMTPTPMMSAVTWGITRIQRGNSEDSKDSKDSKRDAQGIAKHNREQPKSDGHRRSAHRRDTWVMNRQKVPAQGAPAP